jgi:hypothetical protein
VPLDGKILPATRLGAAEMGPNPPWHDHETLAEMLALDAEGLADAMPETNSERYLSGVYLRADFLGLTAGAGNARRRGGGST